MKKALLELRETGHWHVAYGVKTMHYDKCYLVLEDTGGNFIKMSYHLDDHLTIFHIFTMQMRGIMFRA